jgi:tRNA threonylcarbamoyladenosine biosynthesis protein TsaE
MSAQRFETTSVSPENTRDWGRKLGSLLIGGETLGLTGGLGSGKTCFVRGLADGLEVAENSWVRSPSFTLINEYQGRVPLIHMDLFRVSPGPEMDDLLLEEYFDSNAVSVVEWYDRLMPRELDTHLEVNFRHLGERKRALTFIAHGRRYDEIVRQLRAITAKEAS